MNYAYAAVAVVLCAGQLSAAEITVSAAASLKEAFGEIAAQYQRQYPYSKVRLNTAGSGALLQQLLQGAPVDVVAFADEETMNRAVGGKAVDAATRKIFATNTLVVAAPHNSKSGLGRLNDLADARFKRIAIGNPQSVPAGRYAQAALEKAGLWAGLRPKVITTQNVRQSLDYIARGEVDAGLVYHTDALLMKDKVKILSTVNTVKPVAYPIAVVSASRQKAEAAQFVRYVLSVQGQAVLSKYGFKQP